MGLSAETLNANSSAFVGCDLTSLLLVYVIYVPEIQRSVSFLRHKFEMWRLKYMKFS